MDYTGQSLDRGQDGPPKLPEQPLDTDFAKKFPPDPTLGNEMAPAARVWKVYRAEAEAHDGAMLDGWNKTLDVLLIFAGLFSAVATAFLIDSYKLLQPDNTAAYMSTALYLLVMRDNLTSNISLPLPPPLAASASTMSKAVNWLWFTSLLLSLSVALLGILIKQWIVEYNSRNTASAESPRHWAIRHRMFFHAMITWPVADIVSVLPVMLHVSLFLFFGGVALFVWDLDVAIGIWISILGLLLAVFYMACNLLPLWIPECPTSTPLVNSVRRYFIALKRGVLQIWVDLRPRVTQVHAFARRGLQILHFTIAHHENSDDSGQSPAFEGLNSVLSLVRARQNRALTADVPAERVEALEADGLLWLIFSVADNDARAVGMQALGALPTCGALAERLHLDTRLTRIDGDDFSTRFESGWGPVENARIARSMLWSRGNSSAPERDEEDFSLWVWLKFPNIDHPDMLFLSAGQQTLFQFPGGKIPPPPQGSQSTSISSTVLLFLRARHLDFTNLVTALLWCNFASFVNEDWTFILERIVSEGSTRTSLLLLPYTAPLLCIPDLLAQCIMKDVANKDNVTVHRLLISLLKVIGDRPWYQHFSLSSFLAAYIVSDLFAEQQTQLDSLQSLISTAHWDVLQVPGGYPPAMEAYFTLLSSLLPLILRQQRKVPSGTCLFSSDFLNTLAYNSRDSVQNGRVLSRTLRRILMPTKRQPLLSLWDMLRVTDDSGYLLEDLAKALHLAEPGGDDVSTMIDIFLSHLSLRNLSQIFRSTVEYNRRLGIRKLPDFLMWVAPIVQYCVDLRPAWWFKSLSDLREDECADIELMEYMHELEAIPLYRGPCDVCHRLPRHWLDDDDPPSSCGFNPAMPAPSTLANSMSTPDSRAPWYCSLCREFSPAS